MIIYAKRPVKSADFKTHLEILWDKASPFYKKYKNVREVVQDIKNSNKTISFYRLFCWIYPALEYISSYPMYQQRQVKFDYDNLEDKNEVEGVIVKALLEVLKEFRGNLEVIKDKNKIDIYNMLATRIRHKAQNNIYKVLQLTRVQEIDLVTGEVKIKHTRRVYPMDDIKYKRTGHIDFTEKLEEKETEELINSKILEFLSQKDKEEVIIFYTLILKNTGEWEGRKFNLNLTETELAQLLGVTRRFITYRKRKLRDEFKGFWVAEIKPYI